MTKYIDRYYLNWELYGIKFGGGWWGWWQPWVNTVAYYPFREDILDHSGNNNDFADWTYSFSNNKITITSELTWPIVTPENTIGDRTINMRVNSDSNGATYSFRSSFWGTDWFLSPIEQEIDGRPWASFKLYSWYRNRPSESDLPVMWSTILMTWIKTWATMKLYINWVLTSTTTLDSDRWYSESEITKSHIDPWTYWEIIVEDKVWADQEILDYFNQTKSLYGIS